LRLDFGPGYRIYGSRIGNRIILLLYGGDKSDQNRDIKKAREYLADYRNISFCFLDIDKELYEECYDMVVPNLVSGGILIADNAISHREALQPMLDRVLVDERVDAIIVPTGKGELVCRKI